MTISITNNLQQTAETPQLSLAETIEKFKRKIEHFYNYNKTIEQVAEELFHNIPETYTLDQVVSDIFECRYANDILCMLQALALARPAYQLSPYDQVRKAIAENEELTNQAVMTLFREHNLNQEQINACYDLAYRFKRYNIYSVSPTPVQPHEYNINLLWVNLNPQDRVQNVAQNIFKDGLDATENAGWISGSPALQERTQQAQERIRASFMYRVSLWAEVNPAEINLWYDSALVTERARDNTFEALEAISEAKGANLKLRDVRQLSNVRGVTKDSLHPGVPVYYRVDLLKVLIADHMMLSPESPKYCVVSDIDVEPMDPQRLFDQRTVSYLSTNGYVFNRVGWCDFENNFFIFNKQHPTLQAIHEVSMIQTAVKKIGVLREGSRPPERDGWILGSQAIYNRYCQGFSWDHKGFLGNMGEKDSFNYTNPRKVVKSPRSQFGQTFPKNDHRAETFRFRDHDPMPYTRFGRAYDPYCNDERQIEELMGWRAEPLPPPVEMPPLVDVPFNDWKCHHPGYDAF